MLQDISYIIEQMESAELERLSKVTQSLDEFPNVPAPNLSSSITISVASTKKGIGKSQVMQEQNPALAEDSLLRPKQRSLFGHLQTLIRSIFAS